MRTLFNPQHRAQLIGRLDRLTPDRAPKWGRMTAHQVVCHLATALRLPLSGECPREPAGFMARPPFNWLVIYVLPWPKESASKPELFDFEVARWEADLEDLRRLIEEFGGREPKRPWPANVVFGRISGTTWGVLQHRHIDHHLRQFGL
ncbi:MAG: hypothetical protein KJO44_05790 [Gemmatimonadetes bacterium]|nr:hypothetical protein [Gemmatimonadota bacterium]